MGEHAEKHEGHAGAEHKAHKSHGGHAGGGGHEEGHEGAPEWLISFADNVALLMGFFVILLAMNMKAPTTGGIGGKAKQGGAPESDAQMLDLVISIREAFHNPINLASTNPKDLPLIRRIIQRREGTAVEDGPHGERHNVESVRPTDYRRTGGLVLFEEGSSDVDAAGKSVAAEITRQLLGRRTIVEVRGHTSLAEAREPRDRGMRLSFERALAVAALLRDSGMEWDQVRVVACGPGDRATPLARTKGEQLNNQRAEIVVTNDVMPPDPFSKDPSAAAPAEAPSP